MLSTGRQDVANRIRATAAELARGAARYITHLACRANDALARLCGHIVVTIQGSRHRGNRETETFGNVTDGNRHILFKTFWVFEPSLQQIGSQVKQFPAVGRPSKICVAWLLG